MRQFIFIPSVYMILLLAYSASGQTAAADNNVSESITFKEVQKGPAVYGIFEGRTPCGISREMGADMQTGCDHLKWQLILFRDPVSLAPTTYILTTEMFDRTPLKGTWKTRRGTRDDPGAVVLALNYGAGKVLYLYKGDENVLFILDTKKDFLVGDGDFSYTLNRVRKVLRPQP